MGAFLVLVDSLTVPTIEQDTDAFVAQLIVHDAVDQWRGAGRNTVEKSQQDEDIRMYLTTFIVDTHEPVRMVAEKEESE